MSRPCLVEPRGVQARPAILIDSLYDARVALAAASALGVPFALHVREDTAAALGADVVVRMLAMAQAEFPDVDAIAVVDCGDAPGLAIAVLRRGVDSVALRGPANMLRRVADIAAAYDSSLIDHDLTPALDLEQSARPRQACEEWLESGGTGARTPR